MKTKFHIWIAIVLLCVWIIALPATARSQGISSWLGSSPWWDWSDFRGYAGGRIFMPRVTGTVERVNPSGTGETESLDLTDFGINNDPHLFKAFYAEFYVDRLGIRFEVEEDHSFQGRLTYDTPFQVPGVVLLHTGRISKLDMSTNRIGVDLDIIRNPFVRAGIDYTYYLENVEFVDRKEADPKYWRQYDSVSPMTIGFHGRAFPLRIRDVPLTVAGRVRFPVPFLSRKNQAKITEWEISGGLRPSVWETSLFGHSTFSVAIEGGYRHTYLDMNAEGERVVPGTEGHTGDADIKAKWGGAFVQATVAY